MVTAPFRRSEDDMATTPPVNPCDEAAPGTPGTGEDICRHCQGRGVMDDGRPCAVCGGTGKVVEGIGGG
jgi:DnaJ-class molecular chaperone